MNISFDKLDQSLDKEVVDLNLKGELYRAYWFEVGYFCFKVNAPFDYPVYFVTKEKCTCGGFKVSGFCKHNQALKDRIPSV